MLLLSMHCEGILVQVVPALFYQLVITHSVSTDVEARRRRWWETALLAAGQNIQGKCVAVGRI